jgi:hypothetical protein
MRDRHAQLAAVMAAEGVMPSMLPLGVASGQPET